MILDHDHNRRRLRLSKTCLGEEKATAAMADEAQAEEAIGGCLQEALVFESERECGK